VSLDRQTATAEILRVISGSPTDVQPVFEAIAENAMRLLRGWSAAVFSFDGEMLHFGAACGSLPDTPEYIRSRHPRRAGSGTCPRFASAGGRRIRFRMRLLIRTRASARLHGYASTRCARVPMLKNGEPVGTISVSRAQVGEFLDSEIGILQTFATRP